MLGFGGPLYHVAVHPLPQISLWIEVKKKLGERERESHFIHSIGVPMRAELMLAVSKTRPCVHPSRKIIETRFSLDLRGAD